MVRGLYRDGNGMLERGLVGKCEEDLFMFGAGIINGLRSLRRHGVLGT